MIPTIIVTSEKWSSTTYVVFEGDKLIGGPIPKQWIDNRMDDLDETERDAVEREMIDEFETENDSVDEYWTDHMILRSGNDYYHYDEDGMATYLGNYESIDEILDLRAYLRFKTA